MSRKTRKASEWGECVPDPSGRIGDYFSPLPSGLSLAGKREEMAKNGDVEGFWRLLTSTPGDIDVPEVSRLLHQAIFVRFETNPESLLRFLENETGSVLTELVLRGHLQARQLMAAEDREQAVRGVHSPSPALESLAKHLQLVYALIAELTRRRCNRVLEMYDDTIQQAMESHAKRGRSRSKAPSESLGQDASQQSPAMQTLPRADEAERRQKAAD